MQPLLFTLASLAYGAAAAAPPALVVMTYNIHHGRGGDGRIDLDRIAQVIMEAAPHVVCLQEMDRNLPRTEHADLPAVLAEKTGMQVVFGPNYHFDGGDYGNATLSSIPILSHRNVPLPNPVQREPRGALIVTLCWHGQPIEVINTHWGLTGLERYAQAEAIVREKGTLPGILAGDLNETRYAPGVQILLKHYTDVFVDTNPEPGGTFPAASPSRHIDFILVDSHFEVLDAAILYTESTRAASDHLPVTARLRLKDQPAPVQVGTDGEVKPLSPGNTTTSAASG